MPAFLNQRWAREKVRGGDVIKERDMKLDRVP